MKFEVPKNFIDVLLPLSLPKAYTYYLSEEQASLVRPGFRIAVPFGKQKIYTAIAKRIHKVAPQTYEPKPIFMIIDDFPVVTENQLEFWKWLSDYYMCSEGEVLRASLPSALLIESQTIIVKCEVNQNQLDSLSNTQYIVYEALQKQSLTIEEIIKITDLKRAMPLIMNMIEKKVAMIHQRFEEKFKPKLIRVVQLSKAYDNEKKLENIFKNLKRAPKQRAIIMVFLSKGNNLSSWITINSLKEKAHVNSAPIKSLLKKGILIESYQEINRKLVRNIDEKVEHKNLSFTQSKALIELKIELQKKGVVLFEGVTASGKTEVYIELIQEQIKQGKQVLYLLPEISLTSQIVTRLNLRFGNKVLVYHSRFSIHERTEVWNQVLNSNQNGQIIVGARSAVLLPFRNLGLVIVDEEHENSYKQFDPAPRYHARDSVIYLSKKKKAGVVLGSATPSIETAENAINGKYGWVKLKERYGGVALPQIELIDLKKAHRKKKMKGFFTNELFDAISLTISQGKQVILFQNRRGYAPILECESCGHCPQCAQCDVSLTYHQKQNQLRCHYCGYNIPFPSQCHACGMTTLTTKGVGTQQIEEQLMHHFPEVNVGRMDWDSTRGKWDFDKIIRKFDKGKIQILVGTQMVVKGLDFKNVLLVGVINADHVLNIPDFRAHERSYQMLCQVAGRAGRADQKGKVIIQTFQPEHPTLKQVLKHDYESLFEVQKKERMEFHYPPYYRMIRITFKSRQYETVNTSSEWFSNVVKQSFKGSVLGPVFPLVAKVRNLYHKQLLIKLDNHQNAKTVKEILKRTHKSFQTITVFRNTRVSFDVDPY